MWIAREATVKMVRSFHFRTKNSPKWMILESRQRNEENGKDDCPLTGEEDAVHQKVDGPQRITVVDQGTSSKHSDPQ
ncbi:hypothetical protein P5673_011255 [Acropora cervicornis]|uniref:Uncharacterized protein n=1 Tax=Acropora cervicornis TaxID=6130 RepID=A0AAD9QQJ5_ACRCE|nr:hypothetical protein P5673_011255 [Acropora cervicornis]